jgi:hypothetical protein
LSENQPITPPHSVTCGKSPTANGGLKHPSQT